MASSSLVPAFTGAVEKWIKSSPGLLCSQEIVEAKLAHNDIKPLQNSLKAKLHCVIPVSRTKQSVVLSALASTIVLPGGVLSVFGTARLGSKSSART